jgi:hypothetical protein
MKVVNRRKKEEADKRFGDLLRKQVNDHLKAASDTADADTLFAKLEDATVSVLMHRFFVSKLLITKPVHGHGIFIA